MKKVLLIGDSIRMGYDSYVKKALNNVCDVVYPDENCRFSQYILRYLTLWKEWLNLDENVDLVHWNAGHWDNFRIYGDEPVMPIDTYAYNIQRIAKRIQFLFPNAKIVFATTTPVYEPGFIDEFVSRRNSDIEQYNEAACEMLSKLNVHINDLYSLMKDKPVDYFSDRTHFYTAKATKVLGDKVVQTLCKVLNVSQSNIIYPDTQKYHKPCDIMSDILSVEKRGHIYVQKQR